MNPNCLTYRHINHLNPVQISAESETDPAFPEKYPMTNEMVAYETGKESKYEQCYNLNVFAIYIQKYIYKFTEKY